LLTLLAKRLLYSIPVLLLVLVLSFLLIHLAPGDPVQFMLGVHATPAAVAQARHDLGLERPLPEQLALYIEHAFQGDFGQSIIRQASARSIIGPRILPSLWLIAYSLVLSLLLTIPLATVSALRQDRLTDQVLRLTGIFVFAMPSFWLGLMLILLFGLKWHLLPVTGYTPGPLGILRSLFLPALTLACYLAPILMRTLRASLVDALGQEYVEAVRAVGHSEMVVVSKYALRNSLIPMITVLSINIGFLISSTVVIENVFQIPGLGSLLVQSVLSRDYPVIQALVIVFGVIVIATNFAADVAYAVVDPRVRLGGST
jgi:peptide/nickel transport system permease protein